MKSKYFFFLSMFIFAIACKPDLSNPRVESLYKEVMVVHDEVMPEISTIHKLKKSIKKTGELGQQELDLLQKLDEADEAMMQWMSDFGAFRKMDKSSESEKISYLTEEKLKISKVSQAMKASIEEARNYLEEIK